MAREGWCEELQGRSRREAEGTRYQAWRSVVQHEGAWPHPELSGEAGLELTDARKPGEASGLGREHHQLG